MPPNDPTNKPATADSAGAGDATQLRTVAVKASDATHARLSPDATEAKLDPQAPPSESEVAATIAGWVSVAPEQGVLLRRRYRLESLLGQGAMGQVWCARDLLSEEAGERQPLIALKLFLSGLERDPKALALMQREASRAQKLAHPNIGTVFVFDRDEQSGLLFMAMELVQGQPLEELLRERGVRGLGRAEALGIIRGMADGLAYAHSQGIVHCDLKPGNVLVTRSGVPKIVDFGIAQAVQIAGSDAAETGEAPLISGYTPAYASAEALAGEPAHPSDDVYALGLLAYEVLAGCHPFGREPANVARERGLRPARLKSLRAHEWRAVARALSFERSKRYADANQFRRALQGTSTLLKGLGIAVVALLLVAAGLGYRNYRASLPAIPFESLPAATQAEIRAALKEGGEAISFVERTHEYGPLAEAAVRFDHAYALQPRNPDAVKGLDSAANLAIGWANSSPDHAAAVEELKTFRQRTEESHYYEHYAPLDRAIERLAAAH